MNETMQNIETAGAKDLFTFPLDWGRLVGPENLRPDVPPVHMVEPTDNPLDFLYKERR